MDVLKTISDIGIVPVIAIDRADDAIPLCDALTEGGLPAAEITFRTASGREAIQLVAEKRPDVLLGAGTVLTLDQCKQAVDSGAKYIVSPGYFDPVVDYCVKCGIPVLPGCASASDMTKAVNAGLKAVKFFPAEQSGGISFLKALAPVFPLDFMPTGGVNAKNLMDYLHFDRILACGGTWMVKKDLINGHRWEEITSLCRDAVRTMLDFSLLHVGINCNSDADATAVAKQFSLLFGFQHVQGKDSDFSGSAVECMKVPGRGKNGHIAIGTASVDRAVFRLKNAGVAFDESTRITDGRGRTTFIYLRDEIGGFAVHLKQK